MSRHARPRAARVARAVATVSIAAPILVGLVAVAIHTGISPHGGWGLGALMGIKGTPPFPWAEVTCLILSAMAFNGISDMRF